jgi:hypothetical protein
VTWSSLLGLTLFNLFLLAVGAGVLWGVRGWSSWPEFGRLSGLAYLLGTAAFGSVLVLELVIGIPFSLAGVLGTGAFIIMCGLGAGRVARRPRPALGTVDMGRLALPVAGFLAATVVYFEALFRSGRLRGLIEWDAWSFWIPKAKAIYFFGGLDEQFFRDLPGQAYPPLVPAINASAFEFMGSPDVVTLHLQLWFLCLGFVGAALGLLAPRVSWPLLWPFVLLMLVMPTLTKGALQPIADFPLDYFFVIGALLIGLALAEGERWQFISAAILLGAAILTKREGLMLSVCILAAALVVSVVRRRPIWPRLGVVGLGAGALAVPWIVWFATRDYSGWGPEAGGTGLLANLDRVWPSLKLALSTFFDYDLWLAVGALALAALVVSFVAGTRLLSGYFGLVLLFCLAGFTWITWGIPSLPITKDAAVNPIGRVVGSIALLSSVFIPLLLQQAWDRGDHARAGERLKPARTRPA